MVRNITSDSPVASAIEEGEISDSVQDSLVDYNDIFEVLHYRYGFTLPRSDSTAINDREEDSVIEARWHSLAKTIAHDAAVMPTATRPVQMAIDFISYFLHKSTSIPDSPLPTWDLSGECPHKLEVAVQESSFLVKPEKDFAGKCAYIIEPKEGRKLSWTLVITDAATALEMARRNVGPTLENAVNFLVHAGISFNTAMESNTYPPPPRFELSPLTGLGTRFWDSRFDDEEYKLYEDARDEFLRGPFGRAALLKGGIIWRLAKETVLIHDVFDGPSRLAQDYGQLVLSSGGVDLIDDNLTEDQTDVIIGLYRLTTGSGGQSKQVSWWPNPSTWNGCGLDVGYWSSSCETWFRNRLEDVRSGRARPRTTKEWKSALAYQKKTPILVKNTRLVAEMFLSGHRFP